MQTVWSRRSLFSGRSSPARNPTTPCSRQAVLSRRLLELHTEREALEAARGAPSRLAAEGENVRRTWNVHSPGDLRLLHSVLTLYFGPWRWEQVSEGRFYELLGIRYWKWFLRKSGKPQRRWRPPSLDSSRRDALRAYLHGMAAFTREYELRHLAGGAAMQFSGMLYVSLYGEGSLLLITALNALFNGFPILLQRYNRVRVAAALHRLDACVQDRRP